MDFETIDAYVGNRIRVKRLLLGLSQTELSQKLDLSFQQLQKYEKGTNRISAGKLYHIAAHLGEPVSFFFNGLERQEGPVQSSHITLHSENSLGDIEMNKEVLEIVSAFSRVKDPEAKKQFKELLKIMAEPRRKHAIDVEN